MKGLFTATLLATPSLYSTITAPENRASLMAALSMDDNALTDYLRVDASDYIHVPIRALSATEVQSNLFNFGHKNGAALKAAVPLFNNLVILKDHKQTVDGWLGRTSGSYWDELTPGVPPGVNMTLDVDVKADPKVARGLLTRALDSGSVTVRFDYEQSHPDMKAEDFYWKLGEIVDGKRVQALVTKINQLMEYSVVWQGADDYAKVLTPDGKILTPGKASHAAFSFNKTEVTQMDWKKLAVLLGLNLGDNVTEETFTAAVKAQNINVTALAAAQTQLTAAQAELTTTKTELTAAQTKATELEASVTKLTTDLATSTVQVTALNAKVAELTPQADLGKTSLTKTRNDALRLYNLVEGDKATEAMRALIGNADLAVAESFVTSYTPRAEQLAPLKCAKCGSIELSRATAVQTEVPNVAGKQVSALEAERLKASLDSIHGK